MKFTAEDSVKETLFSEPEEPEEPENLLKSEEYGNSTASDEQESERRLVDINTASREELMTLPWIGEVRAEAIISYRETSGKFQTIEEVMNVRGIKEGIFNKISKLICVK
ncbi:MAG: ComEA family DNA-binding protein [Lachnospiraceae bacterium]